eukprot:gene15127-16882_t
MGAFLYFSDVSIQKIRRYSFSTGIVSSVIGSGSTGLGAENVTGTSCAVNSPFFIYGDSMGNIFYSDQSNNRIRRYSIATTLVVTIVGTTGGPGYNSDNITGTSIILNNPTGLWGDSNGNIIFSDKSNQRIRKWTRSTQIVTTLAGTGAAGFNGDSIQATLAKIYTPLGFTFLQTGLGAITSIYGDSMGGFYYSASNEKVQQLKQDLTCLQKEQNLVHQEDWIGYSTTDPGKILASTDGFGQINALWVDSLTKNMYFVESNANFVRQSFYVSVPTSQPTTQPTGQPSAQPSRQPSSQPTNQPT